ncbi:MAG: serpin family protein [Planctomycetes bacterium]|nr:serpin family protein [Planctomycetota bacterium]
MKLAARSVLVAILMLLSLGWALGWGCGQGVGAVAEEKDAAGEQAASPPVAPGAPAKAAVAAPARMVCCDACKAKLDLANGIRKCPGCGGMCNVAHAWCTACARKKGVCEVCGKKMGAEAAKDVAVGESAGKGPTEKISKAVDGEVKLDDLVAGNNTFACRLYQNLAAKDGNLFFSPMSISSALAMVYAGAEGQTAAEMKEALSFGQPEQELHKSFRQLNAQLNPSGRGELPYDLTVANALWGQQGHQFLDDYLKIVSDDYGGTLNAVNFASNGEGVRQQINTWAEEKTRGKIKDLIGPGVLNPLTRLVLTNAIYFKGKWEAPFKKESTREQPFRLAMAEKEKSEVRTVQVPMMRQKEKFGYMETGTVQVLQMPYVGEDLAMLVVLPRAATKESMADLEKSLSAEQIKQWTGGLRNEEIAVTFPRFKATQGFSLNQPLQDLGMASAFSEAADFSGIDGTKDLFLAAVIHKAYVDVNEEGTEAAAATAAVLGLKGMPPKPKTFVADHPFVFMIRHVPSGSVLFMGRVMDPSVQ